MIHVVEQLEDPIDGLPADLLKDAADAIGQLSEQQPDNLFFALRAARLNIATHDQKAIVFVERANRLAKAIEPSIRRETQPIGVTPDELVAQIVTAIREEDWSEAENRMLLWFNVLNSTEIVKTDRRRASPHPLDSLSFDSLRRLSAQAVADQPLNAGTSEFKFDKQIISPGEEPQSLLSLDYDLDLTEILSLQVIMDNSNCGATKEQALLPRWRSYSWISLPAALWQLICFWLTAVIRAACEPIEKPREGTEDYSSAIPAITPFRVCWFMGKAVSGWWIDGRSSCRMVRD